MAESPSHQFGQIVGHVLEAAVEPLLRQVARKHGLYLDVTGKRKARKGRKKITWLDLHGNSHDLDFVFERGGTDEVNGKPVAFIEAAWRRYTKHSRNKAQEIQGAISPLLTKYWDAAPFAGVVLAGEYTAEALEQLRNNRFTLLHFPYKDIVKVFKKYGIDASSDEDTDDAVFKEKVKGWKNLSAERQGALAADLAKTDATAVERFVTALEASITRYIVLVRVLPLHGSAADLPSVEEAIHFISSYKEGRKPVEFVRYEIEVRYSNGDKIRGELANKDVAIDFLRGCDVTFRPA